MSKFKREEKLLPKIRGYKKRIKCIGCGKSVFVKNFNQLKCDKCGYRGKNPQEKVGTRKSGEKMCELNTIKVEDLIKLIKKIGYKRPSAGGVRYYCDTQTLIAELNKGVKNLGKITYGSRTAYNKKALKAEILGRMNAVDVSEEEYSNLDLILDLEELIKG